MQRSDYTNGHSPSISFSDTWAPVCAHTHIYTPRHLEGIWGKVFVTPRNMIEQSTAWQLRNCEVSCCVHSDPKETVAFVLHQCIIFFPIKPDNKHKEKLWASRKEEVRTTTTNPEVCVWDCSFHSPNPICLYKTKLLVLQGVMNNSPSSPALKRHKSQGGPFGTSRLSSAFNSSIGNCWGQAAGRELNSAGKVGRVWTMATKPGGNVKSYWEGLLIMWFNT